MNYTFITSYIIALLLLIRVTFLNHTKYRLLIKLITCMHYLSLGIYAVFNQSIPLLKYLLAMGLLMSFIGDLFLGLKHRIKVGFLIGISAFSIAQLYYLLYLQISHFNYLPFILSLLFMLGFWFYVKNSTHIEFTQKAYFLYVYIFLLSSTLFTSIFNLMYFYTYPNALLMIGIISFFISDITLFHVYFLKNKISLLKIVYLLFYHFAQILIAFYLWI